MPPPRRQPAAASRRPRLSGTEFAARLATAQRIAHWRVDEWLAPRDLQRLKQCNRHLRVRMRGPVGLPLPAAAEQPTRAMQHLVEGPAEMAALPGGWLVPAATRASTAEQRSWRDVLGEPTWRLPTISPSTRFRPDRAPPAHVLAPAAVVKSAAAYPPTVNPTPSAARTRGLRNAPFAAQRPQTPAVSPAAPSSTIHGTDKLPSSQVQSSSSPIMTRPDLEPPCAPGMPLPTNADDNADD